VVLRPEGAADFCGTYGIAEADALIRIVHPECESCIVSGLWSDPMIRIGFIVLNSD